MEKILYDIIVNRKPLKNHSVEKLYFLNMEAVKNKKTLYINNCVIVYGFNKEQHSWFVYNNTDNTYYRITNDNIYKHAIRIVNKLIKNNLLKYYSHRKVFNRETPYAKTYCDKNFKFSFDLYFMYRKDNRAIKVSLFDGNRDTIYPSFIYNFLWDNFKAYCL